MNVGMGTAVQLKALARTMKQPLISSGAVCTVNCIQKAISRCADYPLTACSLHN